MILELWKNFNKKSNSTKQPGQVTETREVSLKRDTSLVSPTFIISGVDYDFNYCKFKNRYYFIRDIVVGNNNVFELQCETDYLATYKSNIGTYNAFIERAATGYNNLIPDHLLSQRQKLVKADYKEMNVFTAADTGQYILRVLGQSGGSQGILSYGLTEAEFNQLQDFLFTESNFEEIFSSDTAFKAIFNPGEYIVDIKWVPYAAIGPTETIKFGWWDSGISATKITSMGGEVRTTLDPFTEYYGDWRDLHPNYTSFELYLPGVGVVNLSPLDFAIGSDDSIMFSYNLDVLSAQITYRLFTSTNVLITYCNGFVGVPIPLAQLNLNVGGITSGITSAISGGANAGATGAAAGGVPGAVAGMITGAAGGVLSAVSAVFNPSQKIFQSNQGNLQELRSFPHARLYRRVMGSATYPTSVAGRPVYTFKTISSLSGYVRCGGASLDIAGLSGDKSAVNRMLNEGFYYE